MRGSSLSSASSLHVETYITPILACDLNIDCLPATAIASTQVKISDTIDVFYGAADRMSDGAMAAAAYKRSTEELDGFASGQMVRPLFVCGHCYRLEVSGSDPTLGPIGRSFPNDDYGAYG